MVERLYSFLESIGFTHPLHPMLTHIPMGMVMGMVLFSLAGILWRNNNLVQTAHHCAILALIFIFFVIIAGFTDWIHLQEASWNKYIIIKMVLAVLLTSLLIVSIILKKRGATPSSMLLVYLLCLACAGGLGYSGGTLAYG